MPLTVQNFVQQTLTLQQTDHVRLKTDQQGNETAVKAKSNFGTKTAEWFRDTLNIKDPATQAFKAAIRAQVTEPQAQGIFANAQISASKPLTRGQIVVAAQSLALLLAPQNQVPQQNQVAQQNQVRQQNQVVPQNSSTTIQNPSGTVQNQGPRPQPTSPTSQGPTNQSQTGQTWQKARTRSSSQNLSGTVQSQGPQTRTTSPTSQGPTNQSQTGQAWQQARTRSSSQNPSGTVQNQGPRPQPTRMTSPTNLGPTNLGPTSPGPTSQTQTGPVWQKAQSRSDQSPSPTVQNQLGTVQNQAPPPQTTQTTQTTSPTGQAQSVQRPSPDLSSLPTEAQKSWQAYENDMGKFGPTDPRAWLSLLEFGGSLPQLDAQQRSAVVDALAGQIDDVHKSAHSAVGFGGTGILKLGVFFGALLDATKHANSQQAPQAQAQAWLDMTQTTSPTGQAQSVQRPAPDLSSLPTEAQKNWQAYENDMGKFGPTDPRAWGSLLEFAGSLPTLDAQQRGAVVDALAGQIDNVHKSADSAVIFGGTGILKLGVFFGALLEATKLENSQQAPQARAQAWLDMTNVGPPAGERLNEERRTLADLTKAWAAPDGDRQQLLGGFAKLGGKLIAAMLEKPVASSEAFGDAATSTGVVKYERGRLGDVAGLLASNGAVKPMWDLIPDPKTDPAMLKVFQDATLDFAKSYGTGAAIAALTSLGQNGASEAMLAPLRDHVAQMIGDRSAVEKIALHGSTVMPRVIDPTAAFARQMVLEKASQDLHFEPVVTAGGATLPPPDLDPKVDPATIQTAGSMDDILGKGFKLKADDGSAVNANGRTLRFTAADGTVVALKFMRANETPGKLQREHESFGLMKAALGDDFAASPRQLGPAGDQAMIRLPKDLLPKEALAALEKELGAKGMTAFTENDAFLVTAYEVEASVGDKFFNYLESSADDATFEQGFTDSMSALGKMAAKGYFNPNLIQNAYHSPASGPGDSEHARGWIWSVNLLQPGKDNTGKEDQQLANAQWSNFREGGLADPDEFRHMDHLRTGELAKLLGDPIIAGELQGKPEQFDAILPTYLIGRMVHEAVVIATRRMVEQGAFADGTPPDRRQALVDTFKESVKAGIEAFAEGFTGKDGAELTKALAANGLDLDKVLDKVVDERAALFSFEYAGRMRAMDADYFGGLYGVDPDKIEFDPPRNERMRDNGKLTPLSQILQSPDPYAAFDTTQQPGFTTILITDAQGNIQRAVDLGWMSNNLDQHAGIFTDGQGGIANFELRSTKHDGNLAMVQAGDGFDVDAYIASTKAKAHPYQNIGGFNATYFFQNEQHLNHVLSATLVGLRAG